MASTLLDAIDDLLCGCGTPLSAKAIAKEMDARGAVVPGGATPWKTIGARLAVDIRSNGSSRFVRVGRGMYALKAWNLTPVTVPARRINPLDEDILVVDREAIERLKAGKHLRGLLNIHYRSLLEIAQPVHRTQAEDDYNVVQLIPSFLIFSGNSVLSFKRTKKTPEQRLHDSFSIVFGGHLQSEDSPALFAHLDDEVERFLFRELHEELGFDPPFKQSRYCGVLHLEQTAFERQHAGVVFAIDLEPGTTVESREPGFQSTLRFIPWSDITSSPVMADRWSAACIAHIQEAK